MTRPNPRLGQCPICNKPAMQAHKPFCSQGCRDRDLMRWLSEGYRMPVRDDEDGATDGLDSARIAD